MGETWTGLEVVPKSALTRSAPARIDRVQVRFFRTLEGEDYYLTEGGVRGSGMWVPLEIATRSADEAWRRKTEFDARMTQARRAFEQREEQRNWIKNT